MAPFDTVKIYRHTDTGEPDRSLSGDLAKTLWLYVDGANSAPMTGTQRAWCLSEIKRFDPLVAHEYHMASDLVLADGILRVWLDQGEENKQDC